jgi:hypothetical protein
MYFYRSGHLPGGWEWLPLPVDENHYRIQFAKLIGGEPFFPARKT